MSVVVTSLLGVDEVVRYSFRVRPGRIAESVLLAEWHRCRFLWNEAVHQQKSENKPTFGALCKLAIECWGIWLWQSAAAHVLRM